ncbi:MAG: hydrogenase iron-sulfur subunit [Desulfomonilaceae bacterium]
MTVPALESVFLNRSPRPETRDLRRVLVLGGDDTGRDLASRLVSENFEVVLLGDESNVQFSAESSLTPGTHLEEVHGFVGGFDVTLTRNGTQSVERVGYVIAAPPAENIPKYSDYGLSRSETVVSMSDLEVMLENQDSLINPGGEWFHAVFLCGLEGDSDPNTFERMFDAIEKLRALFQVQPYIFTRHVKVAADGLEKRYRQSREKGALFFKFDDKGPIFEQGSSAVSIMFTDPVLGVEMELVPNLLVVDEDHRPPSSLKPVLKAIPSCAITAPFLQPESTRFSGVKTPKTGIFALGAARGKFGPESVQEDVQAALVELKTSVDENPAGLPGPPVVDQAKCTLCLTCVRLCPHGAIGFRKRAEVDPASCMRCGICAVECPMEAIKLAPPEGETEFGDKIVSGLSSATSTSKIVAFLCSRSAARAMVAAGPRIGKDLIPVTVPCAGTIDPCHILAAFQQRADGVLVAGCHTGNCASIYGTVLAGERTSRAGLILEEAGINPSRLMFTTLASNTPGDFVRAVQQLEQNTRVAAQ